MQIKKNASNNQCNYCFKKVYVDFPSNKQQLLLLSTLLQLWQHVYAFSMYLPAAGVAGSTVVLDI